MPLHSFAHSLPPPLSLWSSRMETKREGLTHSLAAFLAFLFRPKTHLPPPWPPHYSLFQARFVSERNHMGNCRFRRHSVIHLNADCNWKYHLDGISLHDICALASKQCPSQRGGQMGEKPCTVLLSVFLTPLRERSHSRYHSRASRTGGRQLWRGMGARHVGRHSHFGFQLQLSMDGSVSVRQ